MEETLAKITDFGDAAHGEQMRKYTPDRYMVHPVRVMKICRSYTEDLPILAAALLHDVLEDTPVSKTQIADFLRPLMSEQEVKQTIDLVTDLTDVYIKADYPHLNRRVRKAKELERLVKTSADSQTIKYADILDNSREISAEDPDFARVYLSESKAILEKLDKGEPELRHLALEAVNSGLQKIRKRARP